MKTIFKVLPIVTVGVVVACGGGGSPSESDVKAVFAKKLTSYKITEFKIEPVNHMMCSNGHAYNMSLKAVGVPGRGKDKTEILLAHGVCMKYSDGNWHAQTIPSTTGAVLACGNRPIGSTGPYSPGCGN